MKGGQVKGGQVKGGQVKEETKREITQTKKRMWEGRDGVKGWYYCGEEGLPCIQAEPLAWMNSQEILCPRSLDLGCSRSHGQALYSTQRTVNSAHTWREPKRQNHKKMVNVNSKSSFSLSMVVTLSLASFPGLAGRAKLGA